MAKIKIVKPGLLTTLQDQGRIGFQQFGVPQSGAMDLYSLRLANLLVGNYRHEAALEMTLVGPQIGFEDKRIFAVTGADMGPRLNGRPIRSYQAIMAHRGDVLEFGHVKEGCRGYLALEGGFSIKPVMGSKATYLRGGFGGYGGRALKEGDEIPLNPWNTLNDHWRKVIPSGMVPSFSGIKRIRVIMGPEEEAFTEKGIEQFLQGTYGLSPQSDRMGFRLTGPKIEHRQGADIISGGINLGAIQVPGEGMPIIMLSDRQTTGGYTKIANVISVDIPLLAQLKPGDKISFEAIKVEEAQELLREREHNLLQLMEQFKRGEGVILHSQEMMIRLDGKEYHVLVDEINIPE